MKRWRPQFSLRALTVVVTFVCMYVARWTATISKGIPSVANHVSSASYVGPNGERFEIEGSAPFYGQPNSPVPFLITVPEFRGVVFDANGEDITPGQLCERHYYFWFLGHIAPSNIHVC